MIDYPIVDSHVHLCDPQQFTYAWMKKAPQLNRLVLPQEFLEKAKPVEIDQFVFVEVVVDAPQRLGEAKWVESLAKEEPRLKGMVASAPLEKGAKAAADIDKLRKLSTLRSVRRLIENEPDADFCIQDDFIAGLKLLAPHDIAFDICVFHHHLPNVIKMVRSRPDVRFVLDHIGKPPIRAGELDPWRQNIKELAGHANVWCKISGVSTEADHQNWTRDEIRPYIAHAIECFGFDRVMYGSDWHVLELAGTIPDWVDIVDWVTEGASAEEKRKLFRDNAISFYKLDKGDQPASLT